MKRNNLFPPTSKILGLIFACCLCFGLKAQNPVSPTCKEFLKEGTFIYDPDFLMGTTSEAIVVRKDNIQVEFLKYDKSEYVKMKTRWTGDCDYTLKIMKSVITNGYQFKKGDKIFVHILSIEGNKVLYESVFKGIKMKAGLIKQ